MDNRPHIMLGQAETLDNRSAPIEVDKFFKLTNLNNTWVITKRHNGNIFFKRRRFITCLKNCPDKECLFFNEEEVKAEVARLNSERKKCKYGYENASKYFINQYSYRSWDKQITNTPLPIKEVNQHTKLVGLNEVKNEMLESIKHSLNSSIKSIQKYQKELPERIKQITDDYNRYIQDYSNEKLGLEIKLDQLLELDINKFMEPYETQGDKIVKVLYSKRLEVKTKPDDEIPF